MVKHWIEAFRLRTLPLALSCIGMGSFLAFFYGAFELNVCIWSLITTLCLQILSNLSNDYGDSIHGADSTERVGPSRTVQKGSISPKAMKNGIVIFSGLSLVSGLILLHYALGFGTVLFYCFLGIGLASIAAAIAYTNGKKPYGYAGLGDVSVFVFFGLLGVCGTYFLHALTLNVFVILPAMSCGFFATGVLNVNNIRDLQSDEKAGKRSIPVRIGKENAKIYQLVLLLSGWLSTILFVFYEATTAWHWLFLLTSPLFVLHLLRLFQSEKAEQIDPLLKQLALSTLAFVAFFGAGIIASA